MSRVRILLTIVLPSMLVGGFLFGPAMSHANDGRDNLIADAGDTSSVAARRAPQRRVAQGPMPPRAPQPPQPPQPPHGINVHVNGHKVDFSGIEGMVRGQLAGVREMIRNNPNIPQAMRDKILARLDKITASVDKRLAKMREKGIENLGDEMEQLGDEIEQALDGLDDELENLGEKIGKDIEKKLKNKNFKFDFNGGDNTNDHDTDHDDDAGIPMTPDLDDASEGDMRDAINDLKGMAITPQQKQRIAQIRENSDRRVGAARKQLDELSGKLEAALGNPNTSNSEIEGYVDQISRLEAEIRKARILAWHEARRVLDDAQRKRIEAAAKHRSK